eukprot:TRINITY_DN1498_c0_g9_i1.p1 TRINITY_DN1498_c0_g9~~TRINITY_DN1498_c0_g9_i1.p1  ORF type:complete len:414 (-),score=76.98 TRINITY_DN1498_c0_g9_i1:192-1433(-)
MRNDLALVKNTLHFVVNQLKKEDRLSLISFNGEGTLHSSLTELTPTGKEVVDKLIDSLETGFGTDISKGLILALGQVTDRAHSRVKNDVVSILLFTDGECTHGITTVAGFESLLKTHTAEIQDALSISTFGFGGHHDAELLRSIAELGNGMFYFVETEDNISLAFSDCLGGLLSVIAQKIEISIAPETNVIIKELHTPFKVEAKGEKFLIKINDLYSEETKDFVLVLKVLPVSAPLAQVPVLDLGVKYLSVMDKENVEVQTKVYVNRPESITEQQNPNMEVVRQRNRLTVASALKNASEASEQKQFKKGSSILTSAIESINSTGKEDEFNKKLVVDLEHASEVMNAKDWEMKGRSVNTSVIFSHSVQRTTAESPITYSSEPKNKMVKLSRAWQTEERPSHQDPKNSNRKASIK